MDNNSMKVVLVNTTVREMTMVEQETCVCLLPLVVMDINLHQIFFARQPGSYQLLNSVMSLLNQHFMLIHNNQATLAAKWPVTMACSLG